jgi:hypothetical protein
MSASCCSVVEGSSIVPFSELDPFPLKLHIFGSEGPPRRYRNAYITGILLLIVPVYTWRNAAFATVARARIFAASRLLQQVSKASRWLQLDGRLHHLFRMASAGAVAVPLVVTAAMAVMSMRRVLVSFRRRLVGVECRRWVYARCRSSVVQIRAKRLVARESGMQSGRPGHVMVVVGGVGSCLTMRPGILEAARGAASLDFNRAPPHVTPDESM